MKAMLRWMGVFGVLSLFCASGWSQRMPVYGCLAGRSTTADITGKKVLVKTGNPGLDQALIDDITELDKLFGVSVPVYLLNDEIENAFFTPTKISSLIIEDGGDPSADITGSVFLGVTLMKNEYAKTNGSGMSLPAIIGHEFAHGMQYKNRFPYTGKWRELHADFMAGWFTAHRGRFRLQNPAQAAAAFYTKGDGDFYSPNHHGTPNERLAAFNAGYLLNAQNPQFTGAAYAYNAGISYLQSQGAR